MGRAWSPTVTGSGNGLTEGVTRAVPVGGLWPALSGARSPPSYRSSGTVPDGLCAAGAAPTQRAAPWARYAPGDENASRARRKRRARARVTAVRPGTDVGRAGRGEACPRDRGARPRLKGATHQLDQLKWNKSTNQPIVARVPSTRSEGTRLCDHAARQGKKAGPRKRKEDSRDGDEAKDVTNGKGC